MAPCAARKLAVAISNRLKTKLKGIFHQFFVQNQKEKKGLHLKLKVFFSEFALRDFPEFLFTFTTKIGIFSFKVTQPHPLCTVFPGWEPLVNTFLIVHVRNFILGSISTNSNLRMLLEKIKL